MDPFTVFRISAIIMLLGVTIIAIIVAIKKIEDLAKSGYLYVIYLIIAGQWVASTTYLLTESIWWALLFFVIGMIAMMIIVKILTPSVNVVSNTLNKVDEHIPRFKSARFIFGVVLIILGVMQLIYVVIEYLL